MRNIFFNLCFLATLAATRCVDDAIKDSSLYNEDDFKESVPGKPHFIMFFAPWWVGYVLWSWYYTVA